MAMANPAATSSPYSEEDDQVEVYRGDPATPTILTEADSVELVIDGRVAARIAVADLVPRRQ